MNQNKSSPRILLVAIFLAAKFLTSCAPIQAAESTPIHTREVTLTSTPTQDITPTLTQTPTSLPTETLAPTKTQEPTPQPTETKKVEKEYPLGCFDPEINKQAIAEYLAANPDFLTLEDAMLVHIERYGDVLISAASYQDSETQEEAQIRDWLPLKHSVVKFPDETADIHLGCVTFAYPQYDEKGKMSVETVSVLTDVEIDGKWSGSPFVGGYFSDQPNRAKVFTTREEFKNWLFEIDYAKHRIFRLMITTGKEDILWTGDDTLYMDRDPIKYYGSLLRKVTIPQGDTNKCYLNYFRDSDNWPENLNPLSVDPEAYQNFIAEMIQNGTLPRQAGLFLRNILLK